jgi:hypothetical protein
MNTDSRKGSNEKERKMKKKIVKRSKERKKRDK